MSVPRRRPAVGKTGVDRLSAPCDAAGNSRWTRGNRCGMKAPKVAACSSCATASTASMSTAQPMAAKRAAAHRNSRSAMRERETPHQLAAGAGTGPTSATRRASRAAVVASNSPRLRGRSNRRHTSRRARPTCTCRRRRTRVPRPPEHGAESARRRALAGRGRAGPRTPPRRRSRRADTMSRPSRRLMVEPGAGAEHREMNPIRPPSRIGPLASGLSLGRRDVAASTSGIARRKHAQHEHHSTTPAVRGRIQRRNPRNTANAPNTTISRCLAGMIASHPRRRARTRARAGASPAPGGSARRRSPPASQSEKYGTSAPRVSEYAK